MPVLSPNYAIQQMKRALLRISIAVVILILFTLLHAGFTIYDGIDDAYAQWGAADMVIDYMREHDGRWPPDWEALSPYFDKSNGRTGGWTFAQFQSRIFIDFSADAERLRRLSRESDSAPFNVIHATSFWDTRFGDGPNAMLHSYFKSNESAAVPELPVPE